MHVAQKYLFECMPHSPQKCTCTRACAPMQLCRNFFAMETIANYLESCANITQAVICRTPSMKSVARRCSLKNFFLKDTCIWELLNLRMSLLTPQLVEHSGTTLGFPAGMLTTLDSSGIFWPLTGYLLPKASSGRAGDHIHQAGLLVEPGLVTWTGQPTRSQQPQL